MNQAEVHMTTTSEIPALISRAGCLSMKALMCRAATLCILSFFLLFAGVLKAHAAPQISSLSQGKVYPGYDLTVTGSGFGASQGSSTVTINGTPVAVIHSWIATAIILKVPAQPTTGNVVVTVGGINSNGKSLTIVALPSITMY